MMPVVWRHMIIGLLLFLGGGTLIGWFYARPGLGLLVAALLALAWQVRRILVFERALRTNDFESLRYGEGIWSQMSSRLSYMRERGKYHKNRYRSLLKEVRKSTNAMPDGAIVLNAEYEILFCNSAAKQLVGFKPRKDRGQRVDNLLRDPKFGVYLRSENFSEAIEIRSPIKDGDWLQCRLVPYGADQRLLLIRDVTEGRRLGRMRREFVGNASHELRSPLTVITGYLDTLATDSEVPEEWRKPLEQMKNQAGRMNHIVEELLELSRLESAGTASHEEIVDVPGLLAAARKSVAGEDRVPDIQVNTDSRCRLRGNASEIESVISNLLSNAIRHTPVDGSITLSWTSRDAGADLAVIDTGEGIAEENIPRLTERFFRVDRGRARQDGGVGLGLAIVKHVLGRHDAELEISSTPGEGSSFVCHIPSERLELAEPVPANGGKQPD